MRTLAQNLKLAKTKLDILVDNYDLRESKPANKQQINLNVYRPSLEALIAQKLNSKRLYYYQRRLVRLMQKHLRHKKPKNHHH